MVRCSRFVQGNTGSSLPFFIVWLLVTLQQCLAVCVFGPNNTIDLVQRNDTIAQEMNRTLLDFLQSATQQFLSVSNFNLIATLQTSYNVSDENAFTFVAYGRLWPIAWINETQGVTSNASLTTMIISDFVKPVHAKLQDLATKYSFSIGLFRPVQRQFNFSGLQRQLLAPPLLTTCQAGYVTALRCELNISFQQAFILPNTTEYANLAKSLENGFDSYFRSSLLYAYDFVRVNVLNVYGCTGFNSKYPCADVEFYFFNESRTGREIKSFVGYLFTFTYIDSTGKASLVLITKVDILSETNVSSLALSTTMGTTLSSPESKISSTNFTSIPSSTVTATTSDSRSTNTTITTPTPSITAITNTNAETTTVLLKPLLSSPTTTTQSILPTLFAASSSPLQTISNSSRTSTSSILSEKTTDTTIVKNVSMADGLSPGMSSNVTAVPQFTVTEGTSTLLTTSTSSTATLSRLQTTDTFTTGTDFIRSTGRATSDAEIKTVKGNSTFDPDPWFQAVVPVVTKIYNDHVLVDQKMGTMAPLFEKADFFYIALPAAIGMIFAAIGCILCLQTEWLPKYPKV